MPQYIQYPNYATTTPYTLPLGQTSYTIPLEQARNITPTIFADTEAFLTETNEPLPNEIRNLQDTVDFLRRRIDDITKISLQTANAMRSLKEYLEEYEAATIPVEEVMQFFWKDDDGE